MFSDWDEYAALCTRMFLPSGNATGSDHRGGWKSNCSRDNNTGTSAAFWKRSPCYIKHVHPGVISSPQDAESLNTEGLCNERHRSHQANTNTSSPQAQSHRSLNKSACMFHHSFFFMLMFNFPFYSSMETKQIAAVESYLQDSSFPSSRSN